MSSTSTLPPVARDAAVRRARDLRRVGLVLLTLFVLAGATGLLGTRTTTASAEGDGYELTVTHPAVSRSGHAVKVEVEVRREGGFRGEPVRLRMLSRYFDLFDENGFSPQPDSETTDGPWTYDEFVPPPRGEVFTVSVDTRIEPARNTGERGEVALVDERGEPFLAVSFRTWLVP